MNIFQAFETTIPCAGAGQSGTGYYVEFSDGTSREATPAEILTATKFAAVASNRTECSRRIYARYPAGRQSSVALGIYSGAEAEAQAQIMKDWISDMVAAENTAADAIEAATTVQEVEAVTVAWPV